MVGKIITAAFQRKTRSPSGAVGAWWREQEQGAEEAKEGNAGVHEDFGDVGLCIQQTSKSKAQKV